ncbi:MAG: 8-oxo-dGTP diphosphatase MutT [Candidatus Omnitrophica bacterium]|nr:8-oxo-dGTP diphosphatase MutT [Candidatus Omnitrophota bacterium]
MKLTVAAAVIRDGTRILISKRRSGDHMGDCWEFPGGKCAPNETLEACVIREIREELGVDIEIERFLLRSIYSYPEHVADLHFYLCRLTSGSPRALGCAAWAWAEQKELTQYSFPPANQAVLEWLAHNSALS